MFLHCARLCHRACIFSYTWSHRSVHQGPIQPVPIGRVVEVEVEVEMEVEMGVGRNRRAGLFAQPQA